MTHIKKCKVENILGCKKVELSPDKSGLVIGGENGSGKSSVIWALAMALGGRGQLPPEPVRRGEEEGQVAIELDAFDVTLTVDKLRRSRLSVTSKDGAEYRSPQAMLDKLFGGLSFDPGAFMAMDSRKQLACLRELVKLDFTDLDRDYEKAYEARRDTGRQVKELEAKLAGRKLHEGVPEEEQDSASIVEQLGELGREHAAFTAADRAAADLLQRAKLLSHSAKTKGAERERLAREVASIMAKIGELDVAIEDDTEEIGELTAKLDPAGAALEAAKAALDAANAKAKELQERLANIDAINRKVRENQEAIALKTDWRNRKAEHEAHEMRLAEVEAEKKALLAAAPFPVEGLSFAAEGVTYRGIPFEQLSESEQWEISLAIGFALNPQGIMFMRNSGGLDKKTRARLRDRAAALGVQLFLEVVDDQDGVEIVIEEGEVKEDRTNLQAQAQA